MGDLRIAVVGVGALGRHHARILSALEGATLSAVVDIDRDRADRVAAEHGTRAIGDPAELVGSVDGVVVAVPTEAHAEVALPFLARGIAVLVEKPLARSLEDAAALIGAARTSGAVLAVGHTERYNPAVQAARPLVTRPRFVEVHRLGTFPERSLDIDVVFDLMIHDLDVLLALVGPDVGDVEAIGVPVLTDRIDIANARLRFGSGCIANLTASRISRDRIRKVRFWQPDSYLSIDYSSQELEGWRLSRGDGARPAIVGGKLDVAREEPLRLELADFVSAVRERRAPMVTGEDGQRALALAQRISDAMEQDAEDYRSREPR